MNVILRQGNHLVHTHTGKLFLLSLLLCVLNFFYQATLDIGLLQILIQFETHLVLAISVFILIKFNLLKKIRGCHYELMAIFCIILLFKAVGLYLLEVGYSVRTLGSLFSSSLYELSIIYIALLFRDRSRHIYILFLVGFLSLNFFDTVYLYFTFSHIESMLFDNFNWAAIKGTVSYWQMASIVLGLVGLGWVLVELCKRSDENPKANITKSMSLFFVLLVSVSVLKLSFSTLQSYVYSLSPLDAAFEKTKTLLRDKVEKPAWFNMAQIVLGRYGEPDNIVQLNEWQEFSKNEKNYLKSLGLINKPSPKAHIQTDFQRIILVVFESLPIDYIHYYNDKIPASVTPNFDRLLASYPRIDNYFSAGMPTRNGMNAMINSNVNYRPEFSYQYQPYNLFTLLQHDGYEGYLLRGSSKFFSNDVERMPKAFQMQHFINKEELNKIYKGASGWGYTNDIVYQEGIKLLKKHKNEKIFLMMKTVDLHQPGARSGFSENDLPPEITSQDELLQAVYWADHQLGVLMDTLTSEQMLDDKTLVVITSDHNPHPGFKFKEYARPDNYLRLARIPLIFVSKHPALKSIEPEIYASQLDLAPTLLHLTGIDRPPYFMGQSLFSPSKKLAIGHHYGKFYTFSPEGNSVVDLTEDTLDAKAINKWMSNYQSTAYQYEKTDGMKITGQ